ncbi:glycosyltransferase family 2 protein [Paenibacillus hamazuiensis]|uniref:glycosyltransferase family 2 protein n=1 Tax=Paenibacillus hamazuiensis TaxID=2936508 RepID=UPI00200DCB8C|nr:glycosyltransferase family A protein [Paenibacillus hamazuiensis]
MKTRVPRKAGKRSNARREARQRVSLVKRRPRVTGRKRPAKRVYTVQSEAAWRQWGLQAGEQDAGLYSIEGEGYQKKALNRYWVERVRKEQLHFKTWEHYWEAVKGYLEGYGRKSGIATYDWMLMPTDKTVSAVMAVMNEEKSVMEVLHELHRLPLEEIIIVVNGTSDSSFRSVREGSSALIVHYDEPLGYDVGRAVGAKLASSEIVLFLDGDIPVPAEQLIPFIAAVDRGTDVALNRISPFLGTFDQWDSVSMMKQFLNRILGRSDLSADSLTAVPHAISRKALDTIGAGALMVPPKAQALAIAKGLKVQSPWSVDVVFHNKTKPLNTGRHNPVEEMIVGDHIEAIVTMQELAGERLAFPDTIRRRHYAGRRG